MTIIIHQSEDKFFKQSLSNICVAREFFESHLPTRVLHELDLNSLKLQNQSFIDESFKGSEADVVYSALISKKPAYIYLLSEHQSSIDQRMAWRLLKYCIRIIENHLKQHPKDDLPIVCPLVVYTGNKLWDAPLDIFELFNDTELARETLLNPKLIDIQRLDDAEIKQRMWAGLTEFALKYRKSKNIEDYLKELFPWLNVPTDTEYAKIVLRFALINAESKDMKLIESIVKSYLPEQLRGEAMTIVEAYKEQGRSEGRIETLQAVAVKLIQRGDKLQDIAELTGLPIDELKWLSKHSH